MKKVKMFYKNEVKEIDSDFAIEMAKMAKLAQPKPILSSAKAYSTSTMAFKT